MTSIRTTNALLAVIAACLVCLTANQLIPAAQAQAIGTQPSGIMHGCWSQYNFPHDCFPTKIRVNLKGFVLTQETK